MKSQPQIVQVNESSEQLPNVVTPPPFLNQHSPNSYFMISVSDIDFLISEVSEFHDRKKLGVVMAKYLEPISARDGEVYAKLRLL